MNVTVIVFLINVEIVGNCIIRWVLVRKTIEKLWGREITRKKTSKNNDINNDSSKRNNNDGVANINTSMYDRFDIKGTVNRATAIMHWR